MRGLFRNRNQEEGEQFDKFLQALRILVKTCRFKMADEIVCGLDNEITVAE
jgi:hypothetical protein